MHFGVWRTHAGPPGKALLVLGFESAHHPVDAAMEVALEAARDHGGEAGEVRGRREEPERESPGPFTFEKKGETIVTHYLAAPEDAFEDREVMAKPELGTKRLCAHCSAKFYDLNQAPITCPKCGTEFTVTSLNPKGRPDAAAARAPVREAEPEPAETSEAEFVSLEEADAEAQGGAKKAPADDAAEAEEEVEMDESLDDAAFIEETEDEDTDVTEIIGGDIEDEEET